MQLMSAIHVAMVAAPPSASVWSGMHKRVQARLFSKHLAAQGGPHNSVTLQASNPLWQLRKTRPHPLYTGRDA